MILRRPWNIQSKACHAKRLLLSWSLPHGYGGDRSAVTGAGLSLRGATELAGNRLNVEALGFCTHVRAAYICLFVCV